MRILQVLLLSSIYFNLVFAGQPATFGTFYKPYNADSPWNSKPVNPVFDKYQIPTSTYFPLVSQGAFSVSAFKSTSTDPMVTVYPSIGMTLVYDPDSGGRKSVNIDHWPSNLIPASGGDGHADIIDEGAGIVHSFWQLKNVNGIWRARLYSWAPLNGSGFGDPAHYYQGARAVGVPASAGIIRQHEINDGNSMYYHALAMSLTYNALSSDPSYLFPATAADGNASSTNSGQIPEGSLLMLPSDFDTSKIKSLDLLKVVNTLMTFGAYVVDRNVGTPFYIYVENGAVKFPFSVSINGVWNNQAANELQLIRSSLRRVTGADSWLNGNNKPIDFFQGVNNEGINILSMRGPWTLDQKSPDNTILGTFDSLKQAVVFGPSSTPIIQYKIMSSSKPSIVNWGMPVAGAIYNFTAHCINNAKVRIQFIHKFDSKVIYDSGNLSNGQSALFSWPDGDNYLKVSAESGNEKTSSASATLTKAQIK